jgi:arylsulfatase A-like enzyme
MEHSSAWLVDDAVGFVNLALEGGRPFYLNLWFHIAHHPLHASDSQLEAYSNSSPDPECASSDECRTFQASLMGADKEINRFLDFLSTKDLLGGSTLVVFSGDNGPEDLVVADTSFGNQGILRGRKRSLYEGGIRMPWVVAWPSYVPKGAVSDVDLASVDWLPTVATLAGATVPHGISGRDMTPLLLGESSVGAPSGPLLWDYPFRVPGACTNVAPRLAIQQRDSSLKLLVDPRTGRKEIYNLSLDVRQSNPDFSGELVTFQLKELEGAVSLWTDKTDSFVKRRPHVSPATMSSPCATD